jgi:nickel-dependent lactate racemase
LKLKEGLLDFGRTQIPIILPVNTEILTMKKAPLLKDAEPVLHKALQNPIGCPPLREIVQQKLQRNSNAHAVIVLSDNTRPVPYSGKNGILFPIIEILIKEGLSPEQISMLIASGTHRAMEKEELEEMIDPQVFKMGIDIFNNNCQEISEFIFLGSTTKGTRALINRHYIESDIKILTGLVESHFMTGVSGGRKSICPGLAAEETIFTLHSSPYLNSPKARDLVLEGNPCHEDALEVAKMAPPDMIINVTLDRNYNLTGIFAGELEQAHLEAVKKLQHYVTIPVIKKYDLVITHGGYVGVNHYQLAKAAVIASYIIKEGGLCILAASMSDPDPIGSVNYKNLISKLKELGTKNFLNLILDPSWIFVLDQWQVQMWGHLFTKIPQENLIYCCEELPEDASIYLPGRDIRTIVQEGKGLQKLVEYSVDHAIQELRHILGKEPSIAFLADGPYGIPILMDIEQNK